MPELPEVQTIVDHLLEDGIAGARVTGAEVSWPRTVEPLKPGSFVRQVTGRRITGLRRRGKYLVWDLDRQACLLMHLRMSGRLHLDAVTQPAARYCRLALYLEDGRVLRFHDPRKFGRCRWTEEPATVLNRLGPEPLDESFTAAAMQAGLRRRQRMLKPLLLDQTHIAGLGNIYTDEALWTARLHPCRRSDTLDPDEARRLHRAIRSSLRRGLRSLGTSLGDGHVNFQLPSGQRGRHAPRLHAYGRSGRPCPRCGQAIERIVVEQRGTHLCAHCQPLCRDSGDA